MRVEKEWLFILTARACYRINASYLFDSHNFVDHRVPEHLRYVVPICSLDHVFNFHFVSMGFPNLLQRNKPHFRASSQVQLTSEIDLTGFYTEHAQYSPLTGLSAILRYFSISCSMNCACSLVCRPVINGISRLSSLMTCTS